MLRLFFAVCMLVFLGDNLSGQISINSVNYNTVSLNESNMLQAVIANSGSPVSAKAIVSVKNASGELIFEANTKSFNLATGINSINGITIGFASILYGNNSKALYLKNNGLFSSGNYSYCLKVVPFGTVETGDIYCEEFETAIDDFLSLVTPYDGDTIETSNPLLTWTHSEPFNTLAKNEFFKIVVVEMKENQSADQAVFSNPVIYSKNFLTTHSIPYPQDAKELVAGKSYAWQVQKIANNIIVNKSESWKFTIYQRVNKPDVKYAVLKSNYDASFYTAYNEKILFRFEEPYNDNQLDYKIFNEKQKQCFPELKTEASNSIVKIHGLNTYEIDLSAFGLKPGFYFLEAFDAKKRKLVLKFYVN